MSEFITNAELRIEAERLCGENEQLRSRVEELERFCKRVAEAVSENADVTLFGVDYTPIDSDAAVPPLRDQFREALNDNEKLKEYGARLFNKVLELGTENTKLRELLWDLWQFTGAACKKYPRLFDPPVQGPQTVQLNAIDAFEQRMRELEMEV